MSDLAGDGISLDFFDLLWSKAAEDGSSCLKLRLPDTVIITRGVPTRYFFTSTKQRKDRNPAILRKRKQNVTVESIFDLFCRKASTTTTDLRGERRERDVVAYFIASADCTSRFRRQSVTDADDGNDAGDRAKAAESDAYNNAQCDIEYFDRDGLRRFLQEGRKNQTGILQRFIQPSGGTHNSLVQAIWTPNVCLMERRQTKQSLHDTRFGLYERTVTFEGPDVHSISKPVRGTVLANKIKGMCNNIVCHVSEVTAAVPKRTWADATNSSDKLASMVIFFKVDINDHIWLLFTSSLRLSGSTTTNFSPPWNPSEDNCNGINDNGINDKPVHSTPPLNIDTVVRLGPTIKLNPNANHDPTKVLENEIMLTYCPSCGLDASKEKFYPVPYKTIISHFEHTVDMIKGEVSHDHLTEWPTDAQFIKAAGGVGFGSNTRRRRGSGVGIGSDKAVSDLAEEDTVIPPIIRQLHPRLRTQGYRRYRSDPLFLHKNCKVCEQCFLAYAQLATASFQMVKTVQIDEERVEFRRDCTRDNSSSLAEKKLGRIDDQYHNVHKDRRFSGCFDPERAQCEKKSSIGMILCGAPSLPPAILHPSDNPCVTLISANTSSSMPKTSLCLEENHQASIVLEDFPSTHRRRKPTVWDETRHPLQHLLSSYEIAEQAKKGVRESKTSRRNPYAVDQKLVEPKGNAHDYFVFQGKGDDR